MSLLKRTLGILVVLALFTAAACSSDDDNKKVIDDPNEPPVTDYIGMGMPHIYKFTVEGGSLDGQTVSGEIVNYGQNGYCVSEFNEEKGLDLLSINFIVDENILLGGKIFYEENGQTRNFNEEYLDSYGDETTTNLGMILFDEEGNVTHSFDSLSGSYTVTHHYVYEWDVDLASFVLNFDGKFIDFSHNSEEVTIKGRFIFNLPPL